MMRWAAASSRRAEASLPAAPDGEPFFRFARDQQTSASLAIGCHTMLRSSEIEVRASLCAGWRSTGMRLHHEQGQCSRRTVVPEAKYLKIIGKNGCPPRIRTLINGVRVRGLTIRRRGNGALAIRRVGYAGQDPKRPKTAGCLRLRVRLSSLDAKYRRSVSIWAARA